MANAREMNERERRWCEMLGDVGRFAVLIDLFAEKWNVSQAALTVGVSDDTARAIISRVARRYGVDDKKDKVYRVTRGPRAAPDVTDIGRELRRQLGQVLECEEKIIRSAHPEVARPARVAVPEGPFLRTLLHPLLSGTEGEVAPGPLQLVNLPYLKLMRGLHAATTDEFDAVVTWAERATAVQVLRFPQWQSHIFKEHTFELLLIARTRELRGVVADWRLTEEAGAERLDWYTDPDRLRGAQGDIAVPKDQFPGAFEWLMSHQLRSKVTEVESVGQVFSRIVAGEADYGVLPSYFEVLDRFRVTNLFHYARFLPGSKFENAYHVALLTKYSDNRFSGLRDRLADRLQTCLLMSHLSRKEVNRNLPQNIKDYVGNFYGHFIETMAGPSGRHTGEWAREVIRFQQDHVTAGSKGAGGHVVVLKSGLLVNHLRERFVVEGGVIGKHLLYLVADFVTDQRYGKLSQGWEQLDQFLGKHGIPLDAPKSSVSSAFVALLPYYREINKGGRPVRVWSGIWLGSSSLLHPLANAMILADAELSDLDCNQLSQDMNFRFMMAGANFAGQLAEDEEEST